MFSKSAEYYDEIYGSIDKDYAAEADRLDGFIQRYKQSPGDFLLDVACGTGMHAGLLTKHYRVEGLDLDPRMLTVARKKHPGIRFHQGDMTDFDLERRFDVVVCLFSSIGYARTKTGLRRAVQNMGNHLLPGGVLLIEPWFTPEQWQRGRVSVTQVKKPDLQIVRMSLSRQRGKISCIDFHYLIGTWRGVEYRVETHEMGLFTHEEYMGAFEAAGLNTFHDPEGLDGRGLYIGVKE